MFLKPLHPERKSTLIGMTAILMWSVSLGLFRSISEIFGPVGGAALIFSASGLIASAVLGLPNVRRMRLMYLLGCGALFVAYEIALALSVGLAHDRHQALELGMINYLWPSLTVLLAIITRSQRGSWLLLPAIALCFGGIIWVMKGDGVLSAQLLWSNVLGNPLAYGLAFGAAFLWASYSVMTRRYGQGANGVPLFLLATAVVLWIKYAISDQPTLHMSYAGLAQVLLLGALTATAYSCWNFGIQHGSLTVLATTSYFTPVLSATLTSLWLGITPGRSLLYGVAMVTAGSLLCLWATHQKS
jgi:drug/metabolite transporter (DMT)-like permease